MSNQQHAEPTPHYQSQIEELETQKQIPRRSDQSIDVQALWLLINRSDTNLRQITSQQCVKAKLSPCETEEMISQIRAKIAHEMRSCAFINPSHMANTLFKRVQSRCCDWIRHRNTDRARCQSLDSADSHVSSFDAQFAASAFQDWIAASQAEEAEALLKHLHSTAGPTLQQYIESSLSHCKEHGELPKDHQLATQLGIPANQFAKERKRCRDFHRPLLQLRPIPGDRTEQRERLCKLTKP